jgi:Flp pilus assembly pilin Flp
MGGGEEMSAMWLRFHNRLVDERGTVYVEYVVISALAVLVILGAIQFFFGLLQFGLWYHARQVALGAAQEGARVLAAEGGSSEAAEERALSVLRSGIGGLAEGASADSTRGPEVVSVSVEGTLRGLLPIPGLSEFRLDSTTTSYREGFRPAGGSR